MLSCPLVLTYNTAMWLHHPLAEVTVGSGVEKADLRLAAAGMPLSQKVWSDFLG